MSLISEIKRRKVVQAALLYIGAVWALAQGISQLGPSLGAPEAATRWFLLAAAIGFPFWLALSWFYELTWSGLRREREPEPASPVASTAPGSAPDASVAILPFADMSEAGDQDYFCDGLAEEILNALTRVPGLRVASRTSSFRFRDNGADVREIGRLLNVAAIMEGSVRKAGDIVRVTAQLIDAGNGFHLWSETFDRKLADVFAIQEEIARSVVAALRVSLKAPQALDLQRNAPRDMRAYEFYLRGRQLAARTNLHSWHESAQMYRRAIELDPGYTHAHAGLADVLVELLLWGLARPEDVRDEARDAASRALQLDPDLAEAHVAHAHALTSFGENEAAAQEYERALALDPELYEAKYYYARFCYARGDYARALELFEAAHRVQPDEFQSITLAIGAAEALGDAAIVQQLSREAVQAARRRIAIDPDDARAHYMMAGPLTHLGESGEARRHIEIALGIRPDDFDVLYNAACFYALANEPGPALDLLERGVTTGGGYQGWVEHDADLASLHGEPRFQAIVAQLRAKDAAQVAQTPSGN